MVYYYPPNDDIMYTLQQVIMLIKLLQRRKQKTKVVVVTNTELCRFIDYNDCDPITITCIKPNRILSISCYAWDNIRIESNHNETKITYLDENKMKRRLNSINCITGSLNFLLWQKKSIFDQSNCIKIKSQHEKKAISKLNSLGIDTYGVVHRPAGERDCNFVHDFQYDFSINCRNDDSFLSIVSKLRENHNFPIYIVSNRSVFVSSFDPSDRKITSMDLVMELTLMANSQYLWGAGKSPVHSVLNSLRLQKNLSTFTSLPGAVNKISDIFAQLPVSRFLLESISNLKCNLTPSALDSVLVIFHASDLKDGKMDYFLSGMKPLSRKGNRPTLYFSTKGFESFHKKLIKRLLDRYNLIEQFSKVVFLQSTRNIYEENLEEIDSTKEDHLDLTSGIFYEAMGILSTLNVSAVLNLELDVKFVRNFWFDELLQLCETDTFWIKGSNYRGRIHEEDKQEHLNRVALYNIGDPNFVEYLSVQHVFHSFYETQEKYKLHYDYVWPAMKDYMLTKFPYDAQLVRNIRFIQSNLLRTNKIFDFSPLEDIDNDVEDITGIFPNVVLIHQKTKGLYPVDLFSFQNISQSRETTTKRPQFQSKGPQFQTFFIILVVLAIFYFLKRSRKILRILFLAA